MVQLVEDVQRLSRSSAEQEARSGRRQQELERSLQEAQEAARLLEVKLGQQEDYATVKKDLSILKTLEFPAMESEDDNRPLEVGILILTQTLNDKPELLTQIPFS